MYRFDNPHTHEAGIKQSMPDKQNSDQSEKDTPGHVSWRLRDLFKGFKREPKANAPEPDNAGAQEDPLVRETRRLAAVTRQLVVWTRVIAGIAIFAFFASLLQWDAMRRQLAEMQQAGVDTKKAIDATNRLADAASRQAKTAADTEKRQFRAYVGPVFSGFKLTTNPVNCGPSAAPSGASKVIGSTILCHHFKNYGLTPAITPRACGERVIFAINADLQKTINDVITLCRHDFGPPSISTNWPGEEREGISATSRIEIDKIIATPSHGGLLFLMIKYHDVFGDLHTTYVCRGITYYPPDSASFSPCPIQVPQDD
jgi:hypothetical protein